MWPPLNVYLFTDGSPGHEKQTRSVLEALASLTPLSVTTRRLPQVNGLKEFLLGLAALMHKPEASRALAAAPVALIMGAGSRTHLPMVLCKRRSKAKLVTCMSPDPLLRPWFDLCLVPRHDKPPIRRNIFATFGPPCMRIRDARHDPSRGLILAGGIDHKSHDWDTAAFMAQLRDLVCRRPDLAWSVASSPRTPSETLDQLNMFAGENRNVSFFKADETPPGWIEAAYAVHDQVWVTADSVSMLYEALTAGCRVGVLPVAWKHPENKFQQGIDDLMAHGMILDYAHWQQGKQWPASLKPLHEAERCAAEILKRWWPERLA